MKLPRAIERASSWAGRFWEEQQRGMVAGAILIGIVVLAVAYGYAYVSLDEKPQRLAYSILGAVLASGVFAILLKTFQFLGVYERSVRDVVHLETNYLLAQDRESLQKIAGRVFEAAIKKRFPQLATDISASMLKDYLENASNYYFESVSRTIEIEEFDKEKGRVIFSDTQEIDVRTHDKKPVDFLATTQTLALDSESQVSGSVHIEELGGTIPKKFQKERKEGEHIVRAWVIPLEGHTAYTVRKTSRVSQLLDLDSVLQMEYTHFVRKANLVVRCKIPSLEVVFSEMGIPPESVKLVAPEEGRKEYIIKTLVFPRQGYLLQFSRR